MILVVAYHIWPTTVPGGYVGVDVFFVVSGFLITSHLVSEVMRTGTVDVPRFWARRIRRLLPASFLVLFAVLVATALWLPRVLWEKTFSEAAASALYVQNWMLAVSSVDYLAAENTEPSLVQHFWSLSVEEQFYVIWPLLIVGVVFLLKGARWIGIALAVVFVASLAFSIYETSASPSVAYFATTTRAWEFAAGGLLAFLPPVRFVAVRIAACWGGVLAILLSSFLMDGATPFPGSAALIPVLGAAAVVWADAPVKNVWSPAFAARTGPVQFIGDLSYSLYLWHWPLVVLYPYIRGNDPELKGGVLILIASVVLAWGTKVFVEDPFRRGFVWGVSRARTYGFAAAGMVAVLCVVGAQLHALGQQRAEAEAVAMRAADSGIECFGAAAMIDTECQDVFRAPVGFDTAFGQGDRGVLGTDCLGGPNDVVVTKCDMGTEDGSTRIAIIGNSHAAALSSGLDLYGRSHGWEVVTYLRQECLGHSSTRERNLPSATCLQWTESVHEDLLRDDELDAVVFQSYVFAAPAGMDELFAEQAHDTWDKFESDGIDVIVVNDVPGSRKNFTPSCLARHLQEDDPCSVPRDDAGVHLTNAMWEAAQSAAAVTTVDLTEFVCDDDRCHALIGGVMVYFDEHHLTGMFSSTLAPFVAREIEAGIAASASPARGGP